MKEIKRYPDIGSFYFCFCILMLSVSVILLVTKQLLCLQPSSPRPRQKEDGVGQEEGQFFFFLATLCLLAAHGIQFPDQELNPDPLHRELRVLTTRPPGKSQRASSEPASLTQKQKLSHTALTVLCLHLTGKCALLQGSLGRCLGTFLHQNVFIFLGCKITADGDCSHEIKRCFAPQKKSYDQPRQHIKKQRHYFANKGPSSQKLWFFQQSCMDVRVGP